MKTKRIRFKPFLSSTLCAVLFLLSPGVEPYLLAQTLIQGSVAESGASAAGAAGAAVNSSIKFAPAPLSIVPTNLSASVLPRSIVPNVQVSPVHKPAAIIQTVRSIQVQAPAVQQALPLIQAVKTVVAAPTAKALIPAEAPRTPSQVPTAQSVLETGAAKLSEPKGAEGRKVVLDTLFTGTRVDKYSEDAPAVETGSSLGKLRGNLLKPAETRQPPSEARNWNGELPELLAKSKVYLTRAGQEPVAATLATLGQVLAAHPALKQLLNETGRIRLALAKGNPRGGLTEADVDKVEHVLAGYGVSVKIQVENVPVDWNKPAPPSQEEGSAQASDRKAVDSGKLWRFVLGPITLPFREIYYLARTLALSYTRPTMKEVIGGIVSKAVPSVLSVGVWVSLLAGHPAAIAAAIGLSLGLNIFHGIWINTWSNLQNTIGKQRGLQYQTIFNLLYGQWWGALFRYISWTVVPKTIPPWSPLYWKDMGISTIVGTFFGTLGIQGLNALYDNGRLTRFQRGAIQQFRDLVMCLGGVFLGSGSMPIFWAMFAVQQGLDLGIYVVSRKAKRRPILYIADEMTAATPEFQSMYPVQPGSVEQESPLKQAWKMLLGSPLLKPVVWLVKKLLSVLGKKK